MEQPDKQKAKAIIEEAKGRRCLIKEIVATHVIRDQIGWCSLRGWPGSAEEEGLPGKAFRWKAHVSVRNWRKKLQG